MKYAAFAAMTGLLLLSLPATAAEPVKIGLITTLSGGGSALGIEVRDETYEATAVEAEGEERDRVFARMVETLPRFGDYQEAVERVIPLFRLVRA